MNKKILKSAIILLFLAGYFILYIQTPHTSFNGLKPVEITKGDGLKQISENLKSAGVIKSKWIFIFYVSAAGKSNNLKPGSFIFSRNDTIPEITRDLTFGASREITVTIPEGWNIYEITAYLRQNNIAAGSDFFEIAAGKNNEFNGRMKARFSFLNEIPEKSGFEGYLFPDTYRIYNDSPSEELILKMIENFNKKVLSDTVGEIKPPGKILFELITMASIIEKEAGNESDRFLISGVLWKRFELGAGLQADATINYIRQRFQNLKPTIKISIEDTKMNSPYNTYKYKGLPPGPIGNPGISAIKAAVRPEKSSYFYYLSAPDGKTYYSKTLEEHNIAKAKYLK